MLKNFVIFLINEITCGKEQFSWPIPKIFIRRFSSPFNSSISIFNFNSNSTSSLVVQLGAFVLGIQKLLPAIQKVYATYIANKSLSADVKQTISIMEMKKVLKES